jgi:fructokinase
MHLLGVGEILWDVIGDRDYLGGAVFNLCAHAARLGHDVALVSAVGDDARGRRAVEKARELGISTRFIRTVTEAPTGIVTVTVDAQGQPTYVIHRPAAYDFASLADSGFNPDWICYGTLHSMHPNARHLLASILQSSPQARRFYDVNLRKDSFTPELVRWLLSQAAIVKLNDLEVHEVSAVLGMSQSSLEGFCRTLAARLPCEGVCVTRGEQGCAVMLGGCYEEVPGYPVQVADTVGAGDAFAAALIHAIDAGWPARRAGEFANRLGALVASRAGATPEWSPAELSGTGSSPPA